jgi:hypothetical protein
MQAYQAYYESGRFVPLGAPFIPEGSRAIVTLLDDPQEDLGKRQKAALARFRETLKSSEPLTPEFDEILSQRVNIKREIDL